MSQLLALRPFYVGRECLAKVLRTLFTRLIYWLFSVPKLIHTMFTYLPRLRLFCLSLIAFAGSLWWILLSVRLPTVWNVTCTVRARQSGKKKFTGKSAGSHVNVNDFFITIFGISWVTRNHTDRLSSSMQGQECANVFVVEFCVVTFADPVSPRTESWLLLSTVAIAHAVPLKC